MSVVAPRSLVRVPGDKSISHRSLMLASLSEGVSQIRGTLRSDDVASTIAVLRDLGVTIDDRGDRMVVHGRGLRGLSAPDAPLDCGNSGTTARLMAGVLAAHAFDSTICGDASLSRRPMRRAAEPLEQMGARFTFLHGDDGLPMTVHGAELKSVGWTARSSSAQIKSAILLAALNAQVGVSVTEPARSRDHTERMLAARGVPVVVDGETVSIGAVLSMRCLDVDVPGDPSSAAFFIALAALLPGLTVELPAVCVNPTRTGFISIIQRMGATVSFAAESEMGGEPTATIRATSRGPLRHVAVGAADIPSMVDEIPILACVAARAEGETVISGASELRAKESDRISAVVRNLRAIGVDADERPDGMAIRGGTAPLSGIIETHGDHRLAMAFGVLGAIPGNEIEVDRPDCVAVSYPGFWPDLEMAVQ